jgi:hypothetical protein
VNSARAAAGLRPYVLRAELSAVALAWSTRMARSSELRHNPGLRRQVPSFRWAGENVGYGPSWHPIFEALMASPRHRANILDLDFTEIGVGIVRSGGRIWVTQVFRAPAPPRRTPAAVAPGDTTKPRVTGPGTRSPAAATRANPRPQPPGRAAAADRAALLDRVRAALRSPPMASPDDPVGAALAYAVTMRALTS